MSNLPFMQMYCEEFFAETDMRLTSEQAAYYNILRQRAWINGGWLPDDDAMLAHAARLSPRKWAALKGPIMAFWHKDENGNWTEDKLQRLYQAALLKVEKNRANGAQGGRPPKERRRAEVGEKSTRCRGQSREEVAEVVGKKSHDLNEANKANGFVLDNPTGGRLKTQDLDSESSSKKARESVADPPAPPVPKKDDDEITISKVKSALGPKAPAEVVRMGMPVIRRWIGEGLDLDRDVLPELTEIGKHLTSPLRTMYSTRWSEQVIARRDARLAAEKARGNAPPPQVFVEVDTPQWRAWEAHRGCKSPTNQAGTGWYFASEWPPGFDADSAPPLPAVHRLSIGTQSGL